MSHGSRRGWVTAIVATVAAAALFLIAPFGDDHLLPYGWAIALAFVSVLALAWAVVRQGRHQLESGTSLPTLTTLIGIVIVVFAASVYFIDRSDPTQFEGLDTRIDAVYFTITTAATVGFGDVHATGQIARSLVTVQIIFDLVFLAALANMLMRGVREERERRAATHRSDGSADQEEIT